MSLEGCLLLGISLLLYMCIGILIAIYIDGRAYQRNQELDKYQVELIVFVWPITAPWYLWKVSKMQEERL